MQRSALTLFVVLGTCAIGVSFARSQWVAFIFALSIAPFVLWPHRSIHFFCAGVILTGLGFASGLFPWLITAVAGFADASLAERRELLAAGMSIFVDNFWNGVGLFDFGRVSPSFDRYPVHNAPLQVATETGIFGLLAFLSVLGWCGLRLLIALKAATTRFDKRMIAGLGLGLVGILVGFEADALAFSDFCGYI